jgi:pimeloyl-ACP methyl ester carboxylesterase
MDRYASSPEQPVHALERTQPAVLWLQSPGRGGVRGSAAIILAAEHDGSPAGVVLLRKAFAETDQTENLKKFNVPTLVLHGDADQIVPIGNSAMLSAKLVKRAELKVIPGAPHGMCTTHKEVINETLLGFVRG